MCGVVIHLPCFPGPPRGSEPCFVLLPVQPWAMLPAEETRRSRGAWGLCTSSCTLVSLPARPTPTPASCRMTALPHELGRSAFSSRLGAAPFLASFTQPIQLSACCVPRPLVGPGAAAGRGRSLPPAPSERWCSAGAGGASLCAGTEAAGKTSRRLRDASWRTALLQGEFGEFCLPPAASPLLIIASHLFFLF